MFAKISSFKFWVLPATAFEVVRVLGANIHMPCTFSLRSGDLFGLAAISTSHTEGGEEKDLLSIVCRRVDSPLNQLYGYLPYVLTNQKMNLKWLEQNSTKATYHDAPTPLADGEVARWKMSPGEIIFV